jgi:hypothetical protein
LTRPVEPAVIATVLVVPCYNEANRLDPHRRARGLPGLVVYTSASRAGAFGTNVRATGGVI